MTMKQYTLQDFNTIIWGGFSFDLKDVGVIELISSLADKVGAPSYIKTPVFPKREKQDKQEIKYDSKPLQSLNANGSSSGGGIVGSSGGGNGNIRRVKNKPSQITDDDWNMIRNFQKTELRKTERIAKRIDTIRSLLNKLSETTYSVV